MEQEPILQVESAGNVLYTVKEGKDAIEEYANMANELSKINVNRGGKNGLKGFYAEHINAAENNIGRIKKGLKSREVVLDDNGVADTAIKYTNGQYGQMTQDKVGYTKSDYKNWIKKGRYDGQVLRVNQDNPILKDSKILELAKEYGIKIDGTGVKESEVDLLAKCAQKESEFRQKIHMSKKAPATIQFYALSKQMKVVHNLSVSAAKTSAGFAAGMSFANNMYLYLEGDIELSEMACEVAKDAIKSGVSTYIGGMIMGMGNATLGPVLSSGIASGIMNAEIIQTASTVLLNINGLNGLTAIISAGAAPAFFTGVAIGLAVTTVHVIRDYCRIKNKNIKEVSRYVSLCKECEEIIKDQRIRLKQKVENTYVEWENTFLNAFDEIIDAALGDDVDKLAMSLNDILKVFDEEVKFKNYAEFDKAFSDVEFVLRM